MRKMIVLMMVVIGFGLMSCANPMGSDMTETAEPGATRSVENVEIVQVQYNGAAVYEESISLDVEIYWSDGDKETDSFTYVAEERGTQTVSYEKDGVSDSIEVDFVAVDSIEITSEDVFEVGGKNRAYTEDITFDITVTFVDGHNEDIVAEYPNDVEDIGDDITFEYTKYNEIGSMDVNIQDWRLVLEEGYHWEQRPLEIEYDFNKDGTYNNNGKNYKVIDSNKDGTIDLIIIDGSTYSLEYINETTIYIAGKKYQKTSN